MRSTTLLSVFLVLLVTDASAGVLRIPLTHHATDIAPFAACSSTGRLRAFYGEHGTGISLRMTGLLESDGDGIPCSGDEFVCLFESDLGTVLLRPEISDGTARTAHDLCAEGGFCPIGFVPIATGDFSVRCYQPSGTDYQPPLIQTFAPPYTCEGIALGKLPTPPNALIARDGVMLSCP